MVGPRLIALYGPAAIAFCLASAIPSLREDPLFYFISLILFTAGNKKSRFSQIYLINFPPYFLLKGKIIIIPPFLKRFESLSVCLLSISEQCCV